MSSVRQGSSRFAGSASAQITTGMVAGSLKDAQGGVIPGATVTLDQRSARHATGAGRHQPAGDFVFPNVPADTYTVEVDHARRSRRCSARAWPSAPADRVAIPALTLEVGGTTETVDVKGESPLIQAQSGERSFTVATDSVQNLPIASRSFTALAALAPGVTGTSRIGDALDRRRQQQRHDGRRVDDGHRQQPRRSSR